MKRIIEIILAAMLKISVTVFTVSIIVLVFLSVSDEWIEIFKISGCASLVLSVLVFYI